ncbi:ornithine cyclodeaminase family protein [Acuticoccus kandeliae]|uniref:ornithine cyclodeaminase family protein n=1 Tax=Acuticoccus kandeliae TaxID=2073160 RepID=UPI000D3ECF48|nr:ornithine cyclodeaminase family protein [Acuticoccus kandeliae]
MIEDAVDGLLLIDEATIRAVVTPGLAFEAAGAALRKTSNGIAEQDIRRTLPLPGGAGSCLSLMAGILADQPRFGAKVLSVFPDNFAHGLASHRGVIVLFDRTHGRPVALLDGGALTQWRTAAASAVATDALARPDSAMLCVLGYGEQARRHVEAIAKVRPIRSLRVWGRDPAKAARFADDHAVLDARPVADAREAVADADIICTATSSETPVLFGDWLPEGVHINAVGASVPACRELDAVCVRRARVFVDWRTMALAAAAELIEAGEASIEAEIGAVLEGTAPGRRERSDITIYRSLGVPAQDIELANLVYAEALRAGLGTTTDFRM